MSHTGIIKGAAGYVQDSMWPQSTFSHGGVIEGLAITIFSYVQMYGTFRHLPLIPPVRTAKHQSWKHGYCVLVLFSLQVSMFTMTNYHFCEVHGTYII